MTDKTVYIKTYKDLPINKKEILRYAGCKGANENIERLVDECIEKAQPAVKSMVCYQVFDIKAMDNEIDLGFATCSSASLMKNLRGCEKIILFGATVGLEIDRLIAKYGKLSPSKGLIFQAFGTERIETLCDEFCKDISAELNPKGEFLKPRFSPGYGDLPLNLQSDIFGSLKPQKSIGLTLNNSMLMSPSKSVTAIMGITKEKTFCAQKDCKNCMLKDCEFRSN